MPKFEKSVLIEAPVDAVFLFHEREDALSLLSPAFPPVRVLSRTGGIEKGARVELKIGVITWVAVHTAFERNRLFEDEQVGGPFARWRHRHEFEVAGINRTILTDRIDYELPGGALINALFGWTVRVGLRNMFSHRHQITKTICETNR